MGFGKNPGGCWKIVLPKPLYPLFTLSIICTYYFFAVKDLETCEGQ